MLLKGEQPRALAVSPDGSTVYCAFFESGNATTVINGNQLLPSMLTVSAPCNPRKRMQHHPQGDDGGRTLTWSIRR